MASAMIPTATPPAAPLAPKALRHRRSVRRLTTGQRALRNAIAAAQAIGDDRGYQYWAGIHGLPLPISCKHHVELFLPWHRAYLYLFEKALQDLVPGVTLPWWDWTVEHAEGIPAAYTPAKRRAEKPAVRLADPETRSRKAEPDADDARARAARANCRRRRVIEDGPRRARLPHLPDRAGEHPRRRPRLDRRHDGSDPGRRLRPLFYAHHCMIDRVWYLWQLRHGPGCRPGCSTGRSTPFPMTVRDTLEISHLGYDYAASTAAVGGP